MRTLATLILVGLMAAPAAAQDNGRNGRRAQGVPPGQLPPAGLCRVWYEGRPPGQQPRAVDCDQAERIASRDRNARVIYGSGSNERNGGWWDPDWNRDNNRNTRRNQDRYGYYGRIAFDNGTRDGYDKGREDARDDDDYDPVRHSWYRSGTRGYESRYGSREQYRNDYREGFERGYAQGYRENTDRDNRNRTTVRRWP